MQIKSESEKSREEVLKIGVSQISGASKTSVGGYEHEESPEENSAQFDVDDNRSLDDVVMWLMKLGYVPSFCTACYREGRTGDRFMRLAKSGQIGNVCHPNALMTLNEYMLDYASAETQAAGNALIKEELENIGNEKVRTLASKNMRKLEKGERDFRF